VALDVHRLERAGDGTGPDRRARMVRFEPFFTAHSLLVAGAALMRPMEDDESPMLEVFLKSDGSVGLAGGCRLQVIQMSYRCNVGVASGNCQLNRTTGT
jgi:hypothetical protein